MASHGQPGQRILQFLGPLSQQNEGREIRVVVIADVDQTLARQSYLAHFHHPGDEGRYTAGEESLKDRQSVLDELVNLPNGNWDVESVAGKVSQYPPVREVLRVVSELAYRMGFGFGLYEGAKEAINLINPSALYLISISPEEAAKAIGNELRKTGNEDGEMEIYAIGNDYKGRRPLISSSNKEELIARIIAHEVSNHGDEKEIVVVLMGNSPHDIPELNGKKTRLGNRTYTFGRREGNKNHYVMQHDDSSIRFMVYRIAVNPKPGMDVGGADVVVGGHGHYNNKPWPRAIKHVAYYLRAMFGKSPWRDYQMDTH